MKRLAVITSCVDLPYRDIEVFLESLKMSGYSSDVVVFARYRMPMPHYVRLMSGWDNSVQFFAKRWHYYRRVLADYDYVLCADSKDVIFQKDPSTWMAQNGLHVTEEHLTIGEEPSNTEWVQMYYRPGVFEAIQHQKVLCAGTVWGDSLSVLEWCNFVIGQGNKMDQAMLNVGVYTGSLLSDIKIHPNGNPVWTLGTIGKEFQYQQSGYKIALPNGDIPPLIHQYNRDYLGIRDAAEKRYRK